MTQPTMTRYEHLRELNSRIRALQDELSRHHGFTLYRESEWLNNETLRHVRMGYASHEWTITVSDFPAQGYNGVAQLRMAERAVLRLDTRMYQQGRPMPSVPELVALITQ